MVRERSNVMEKIPIPIPDYYQVYGLESGYPEISTTELLMNKFEAHEGGEREFVQRYKEIAEKSKNSLIKFLLKLIISDEEKHHAITHTMVSTLKDDLTWTRSESAFHDLADLGKEKDELLDLTGDFIQVEKKGIKEYKKLIKESRGYYRGLFVLLLQSMIRDSEKHVEILRVSPAEVKRSIENGFSRDI